MTLEEILKQHKFNLPYLFTIKEKLSVEDVKGMLLDYRHAIESSIDLFEGIFKENSTNGLTYVYDADKFKSSVLHITDGIIESLDTYLEGYPSDAYHSMHNAITGDAEFNRILASKINIADAGTLFYRLRSDDDKFFDYPLTASQIFHVPFQKRFLISPQRFSISGYPSLYLSGALITACSEMDVNGTKKNIQQIKTSAFKNIRSIKYIDLAAMDVEELLKNRGALVVATVDDKIKSALYDYGVLFPLISACHTKITYEIGDGWPNFKIEYIIPQIILQWSKVNNKLVDGIRYFCTRITPANKHNHEDVYNFVFPVRKSALEGHCAELQAIFSATDVIEGKKFTFKSADLAAQIKEIQDHLKSLPFKPV